MSQWRAIVKVAREHDPPLSPPPKPSPKGEGTAKRDLKFALKAFIKVRDKLAVKA